MISRIKKYQSDARENSVEEGVKYNPLRAPRFRVNTIIENNGDDKKVIKTPDNPTANEQINRIVKGKELLNDAYRTIQLVDFVRRENDLVFPFVNGTPLMSDTDLINDSIDKIVNDIKRSMDLIFDYKAEPVGFVETEQFRSNFPGIRPDPSEECYPVINLDSNVDNFIKNNDSITCIDYEWVEDYPIPIRFVKFRLVFYFYLHNIDVLKGRIGRNAFIKKFGFSNSDIRMFDVMEQCFQLYIVDLGYKGSRF